MQGSLPAGWLAFTGRASNPLDHNKRFQITHPPFLDLSWRYRDELPSSHIDTLRSWDKVYCDPICIEMGRYLHPADAPEGIRRFCEPVHARISQDRLRSTRSRRHDVTRGGQP